MFNFLCDRKILIGIGIGIILSTGIMTSVKINYNLSRSEIEKKAMDLGMKYPEEMKVINKKVK
ncbi:hypothetical protein FDF74_01645 [Clostridium niameyense]|uniref:Uncharacterized protein n=1 Tax=Clostridium niameyense TaxID=1622073 RepID=A0A6M0R6U4_9CLOT|nr:hypothetical protein [Clostridium niameyense]NEZ45911.1 hypothetical protein [Clostridium niameyense]